MKVFIDESLGIPKEWLKGQNVLIRKVRLKKDQTLEEAIEVGKKSFLNQNLSVRKSNIQTEMDEMLQHLHQEKAIFYFYDQHTTNSSFLKRISNWSFPNLKLYLIEGSNNRAFTMFLLKELQSKSFDDVYQLASTFDNQKLTITNDLKYYYPSHYLNLKERNKKQFHLLKGSKQMKITSGNHLELIEKVFDAIPVKRVVMTSRKPIDFDRQGVVYYQLEEKSLPISSDKIDLFIRT